MMAMVAYVIPIASMYIPVFTIIIIICMQSPTPTWISVHPEEEARSLLLKAIETLAIAVSINYSCHGQH